MHPSLDRCFSYFAPGGRRNQYDIVIVGSACRDVLSAHDIDLLFDDREDFPLLCQRLGVKYNGWDTPVHHVRRANLRLAGVDKPIHLLHWGGYDPGHCQLRRDGTFRHKGCMFNKRTGRVVIEVWD